MRILLLGASLLLAVSSLAQAPDVAGKAFQSKSAYQTFLRTTGGDWVAQWNPATLTPSAIYGTGLPLANWHENTLEHARSHANQVLVQYRDLLGLGTSEFRESIGARMGRTWSFVFDQYFRGLPVIGGRADVRIHMTGAVSMMGSTAFPIPADFNITPALTEELARAIAWGALEQAPTGVAQPGLPRNPQLVIWGDAGAADIAPFALAWEVPISNVDRQGAGPIGRYYVDAKTGAVLHYRTDKHECGSAFCANAHHGAARSEAVGPATPLAAPVPTTVTVMGWTRTGNDAFSALVNVPLQGIVVSVPGIGTRTTDSNGEFTIDIAAPVTIAVTTLDGTHHAPITGANNPAGNFLVNPGVNSTIQLLTAAATTYEAAHTTTAYWVDRTNEFCRVILGNSAQLNTASTITPRVNIASTCNAYYTGNTINFYSAGGGCSNTAFSTVIAHEWGHGLDERYGGIANSYAEGLSEGWGDIIALYLVDSPILGSGFQTAGVGIRNGMNTRLWPYSSATAPHPAGEVWMGFAWRLRENLRASLGAAVALPLSNDIVIGSIVANATTRVNAVLEVFIADDDDANLNNGTPHYAELSAAAIAKGIAYPPILVASIAHTPLGNTTVRLTPRKVDCTAASIGAGSVTQVRLHYNAGAGNVIRNMHPNGGPNGYRAMLPGLLSGSVAYHIEAVHSSGPTVRLPVTGEYSYIVDAAASGPFTQFWAHNFDGSNAGWTSAQVLTQNDWQVGDPAGRSGTSEGVTWADPQTAASAPNCYSNDLGNTIGTQAWNGSYAANVENYLRSPVLNCTGRTGVTLRFKRWLTVEEGLYDQATIRVNGIQVWQNPQSGHLRDTVWTTVEYSIPMADNNAAVQIEWRLKSDQALQLGGWNIDDIEVGERYIAPLEAELRMLPEQAVQLAPLTLTVQTQGGSKPFLLIIGDTGGPTFIAGVPTLLVGGAYVTLFDWTDAAGAFNLGFGAPPVASSLGTIWYTQVLTFNGANTSLVTSNQFQNLFTLTP